MSHFFFCVPSYISGVHFRWDFCLCDRFFNLTIEVVTFCLHGWCMLGVLLLPASVPLGHECQNLLSLCDGMHVYTNKTSVYTILSSQRVLGIGVRTHVNSKKKSPLPEAQWRVEPVTLHHAGQWVQHITDWAILAPIFFMIFSKSKAVYWYVKQPGINQPNSPCPDWWLLSIHSVWRTETWDPSKAGAPLDWPAQSVAYVLLLTS